MSRYRIIAAIAVLAASIAAGKIIADSPAGNKFRRVSDRLLRRNGRPFVLETDDRLLRRKA